MEVLTGCVQLFHNIVMITPLPRRRYIMGPIQFNTAPIRQFIFLYSSKVQLLLDLHDCTTFFSEIELE